MEETVDFSQTQRIVFLIDLNPLFNHQNPKTYISSIISSSQTFLTFASLSSSLFTFKFFFSSLSPLLSSSKLRSVFGKFSPFFSFDHASQTLISLSEALNSISSIAQTQISLPKACFTASSLCQLMHDYIWESQVQDVLGNSNSSSVVRSNLIIVFSMVPRTLTCLSCYLDMDLDEELVGIDVDVFCENLARVFNPVNDGLVSRDIHCSWIDVSCEEETIGKDQPLEVFKRGIKNLGWGFCSTDAIILGSALVSFGMIYPNIGCASMNFYPTNSGIKGQAELSLAITDVSGMPLECNCCDLELLDLKHLKKKRHEDISGIWDSSSSNVTDCTEAKTLWRNQITKISVKQVWRKIENLKLRDSFQDYLLLRGSCLEHRADAIENISHGFFADKVLEILCMEASEFASGKPIWPVFLNFLYRNNNWALVSVSNGENESLLGILKPFTTHSALICILDKSSIHENYDLEGFSSSFVEIVHANNCEMPIEDVDVNQPNGSGLFQHEALCHTKSLGCHSGKKKNHKKSLRSLQNLSWSSFREAVISNNEMDLEDMYFGRGCNISKKMKFLKCWMKQTKKSIRCFQIKSNELKPTSVEEEELIETLAGPEQENEYRASSSFSAEEPSLVGPSNMVAEAIPVYISETPEAFSNSISQKIQQGLESKDVDLGALAERLVESSIYWLCLKHEKESVVMTANPEEKVEDCGKSVAVELVNILLREPKDLTMKYKGCGPPSSASELSSTLYTSKNKAREYELQILFRMEILRSKVQGIEEISKKKMVKQICLLLDVIQYHLEGGCFGDVSLDKYVEKTIKTRYSYCLGDVVDKIYTKMDLLLCCEDEKASGSQINSEDGTEAQREMGENGSGSGSASTSASMPIKVSESYSSSPHEEEHHHQSSLLEAEEKRKRAHRFLSFTRRVQDLQRVWAPKQQPKALSLPKVSKRKESRGARFDVVCETPMTGKKRSCVRDISGNGNHTKASSSVSKALFQDDVNS